MNGALRAVKASLVSITAGMRGFSVVNEPASTPHNEVEFSPSPQDQVWKDGENIGRVIYEQPTLRARTRVSAWLGEIQPTTPR
jgi:hypothetical protein